MLMVILVLSDPLDLLDHKDPQASPDPLELREIAVVPDLRDLAVLKVSPAYNINLSRVPVILVPHLFITLNNS